MNASTAGGLIAWLAIGKKTLGGVVVVNLKIKHEKVVRRSPCWLKKKKRKKETKREKTGTSDGMNASPVRHAVARRLSSYTRRVQKHNTISYKNTLLDS